MQWHALQTGTINSRFFLSLNCSCFHIILHRLHETCSTIPRLYYLSVTILHCHVAEFERKFCDKRNIMLPSFIVSSWFEFRKEYNNFGLSISIRGKNQFECAPLPPTRKKIWLNQRKWFVWTTFFDLKRWFVWMK